MNTSVFWTSVYINAGSILILIIRKYWNYLLMRDFVFLIYKLAWCRKVARFVIARSYLSMNGNFECFNYITKDFANILLKLLIWTRRVTWICFKLKNITVSRNKTRIAVPITQNIQALIDCNTTTAIFLIPYRMASAWCSCRRAGASVTISKGLAISLRDSRAAVVLVVMVLRTLRRTALAVWLVTGSSNTSPSSVRRSSTFISRVESIVDVCNKPI